jgi:hypothetical protein
MARHPAVSFTSVRRVPNLEQRARREIGPSLALSVLKSRWESTMERALVFAQKQRAETLGQQRKLAPPRCSRDAMITPSGTRHVAGARAGAPHNEPNGNRRYKDKSSKDSSSSSYARSRLELVPGNGRDGRGVRPGSSSAGPARSKEPLSTSNPFDSADK